MNIFHLFILTVISTVSAQNMIMSDAKDCYVYYINFSELRNVSYNRPITDSMQIGFLHRSHDHADEKIQIFVYFPGSSNRHLLIYINAWKNISILNTKHEIIAAAPFDSNIYHQDSPFWNYLIISMTVDDEENSLVSVLRPGDVTPIVSAVKDIGVKDHTRFRYTVVSNIASYVTFNCLSKCPVMTEETSFYETFTIPISSSFFIDVMPIGSEINPKKNSSKTQNSWRQFGYKVEFIFENSSRRYFQKNQIFASFKEFKWRCVIRRIDNSTEVVIKWNEIIEYQEVFSDRLSHVLYTVGNNENNTWTFNCNPSQRPNCCGNQKEVQGNSFGFKRTSAVVSSRNSKSVNGIGETIAWIIALLAVLGVLAMGVALFIIVRPPPDDEANTDHRVIPQIKIDSGEESSARNSFRKFKSSFRRKPPEECSEPGDSEPDPNMLTTEDQFYPLQIITDDEQSETDFGSLETRCTSLSIREEYQQYKNSTVF